MFIELSNTKLATFGLSLTDVTGALAQQNAKTSAGFFETDEERIYLRPDGDYADLDAIRATLIRAGGRSLSSATWPKCVVAFKTRRATACAFHGQAGFRHRECRCARAATSSRWGAI